MLRFAAVHATLQSLQWRDSTIDTPLGGDLWFIKTLTVSDTEIFYSRFPQPLPLVLVLNIGESDPVGAYRVFAHMVTSGKYHSTLRRLGCEIPEDILKNPNPYRLQ